MLNFEKSTRTLVELIMEGFHKTPIALIPYQNWYFEGIVDRLQTVASKIVVTSDNAVLVWADESQYKLAGKLPSRFVAKILFLDNNLDEDLFKRLEHVKLEDIRASTRNKLYAEVESGEVRGGFDGKYSIIEHRKIVHPENTLWMWEDLFETNGYYALVSQGNKPPVMVKMKLSDNRPGEGAHAERHVSASGGL